MTISKSGVRRYLARPLDSFTWMKRLPREEILKAIKTLRVRPVFKGHDRWTHQLVCFWIGICNPEFLWLLDMGLGKTAIHLDLMTQFQREKRFQRGFITVPRQINIGSWKNDILTHSEFEPILATGSIEEKWDKLAYPKGDIAIIDYPGLQFALTTRKKVGKKHKLVLEEKKVAHIRKLYDYFGFDEIHKAKNTDTLRFQTLRSIAEEARFAYGSTGTLFGRYPEDIFAQFQLVDNGSTFGNSMDMFKAVFFEEEAGVWGDTKFTLNPAMTRTLHRFLQNRSIRYTEDEVPEVELPSTSYRTINCGWATDQREHYLRAVEGLINARGSLQDIDSAYVRMRQIVAGFLQWRDPEGNHTIRFTENSKLEAIERLVEESGQEKIIISHEWTESGKMITERLTALGYKWEWLYGGTKDPIQCAERFKADRSIKAFVMNSESGGTGTDGLQNVARYLVMYESPASPITRTQLIKRVRRPGQKKRTFIYDLVTEKSIDLRILEFIAEGKSLHEAIVNGKISRGQLT